MKPILAVMKEGNQERKVTIVKIFESNIYSAGGNIKAVYMVNGMLNVATINKFYACIIKEDM